MEIKNISWNVKQLVKMSSNGTLKFDYPIQRSGGQWKPLQKSYLIHSLTHNYPIPPVYLLGEKEEIMVEKNGKRQPKMIVVRYILDGKQRITTMKDFIEDQFKLHDDTPETTIDGEDYEIAGKLFSELDEEVQDMILSRSILTYTLDGDMVTDEEIEDLFFRMNNGSALTTQQKAKALMGTKWAIRLTELGNHQLIQEFGAFSKTQLKADGHLAAIIQTMMMIDNSFEYNNVSQKTLSDYSVTFKDDLEYKSELLKKVEQGMDYLVNCFDKKETLLLKKVHFPITLITGLKAIEMNVSSEGFSEWAVDFKHAFKPKKNSEPRITTNYEEFTGSGSTRKEKADGRMNEMLRHMEEFVKTKKLQMISHSFTKI
ncbi:DUF262 domain-containing protein [Lentibacillus sp. N15]|uniref:DUF262 domain-containing protein n=1 Tax=Lentibacillus songyuanensis TaxID=3136161 RepID=UPI0031BB2DAC